MVKQRFFLLYFFLVQFRLLIQFEQSSSEFDRDTENQRRAGSGERVALAIIRRVVENVRRLFERRQMKRRVGDVRQADSSAAKY